MQSFSRKLRIAFTAQDCYTYKVQPAGRRQGAVRIKAKAAAKKGGQAVLKKDGWFASLQNLTWLTQLGLSLAVPPVLCLFLAGWLAERFLWGPWVWAAAILLGVGASACTFAEFMRMFLRRSGGKKPPDADGPDK